MNTLNTILTITLVTALILPNAAGAKPCGDSYISDNETCHKGGGGDDSTPPSWGSVILWSSVVVGGLFFLAWATSKSGNPSHGTGPGPNVQRGDSFESFVQDLGGTVTITHK